MALATRIALSGLILHGTATFALALTSLTNHEHAGEPLGRSSGDMVLCPSTARLEVFSHKTRTDRYRFDILCEDGSRAVDDGS